MHLLLFKILILIPLLVLLGILTYKKINETFDNRNSTIKSTLANLTETTAPQTTAPQINISNALISTQLTIGIASILGVSVRRITNLDYSGDINKQSLAVSFSILDPNLIEASKNELSAVKVANNANDLFSKGNFIIPINGINVKLTKINQNSNYDNINSNSNNSDMQEINYANYFNNKGLLDTANYAKQIYDTVPVDSAATRFFTLQPDNNFNLIPILPTSK